MYSILHSLTSRLLSQCARASLSFVEASSERGVMVMADIVCIGTKAVFMEAAHSDASVNAEAGLWLIVSFIHHCDRALEGVAMLPVNNIETGKPLQLMNDDVSNGYGVRYWSADELQDRVSSLYDLHDIDTSHALEVSYYMSHFGSYYWGTGLAQLFFPRCCIQRWKMRIRSKTIRGWM